jgi:hypothetical protein
MEEEIICNRWKDLDGRNKEKKGKSVQKKVDMMLKVLHD